jgi:hypothetical protein
MTPAPPNARREGEHAADALAAPARGRDSPGSPETHGAAHLWGPLAAGAALFCAALLYFRATYDSTLEWVDEGQLIYASSRVADGAVPYRDFVQLYGPSVFFLNGALFRLFGADVHVVRVSLLLLKAALAVIVYLCARRVAGWPFALVAYGLFVVGWGSPLWVFNAPYSNHYGIALGLTGILLFLSVGPFRLGCALAGLSFGAAATFKQTSGIFLLMAFVLFLLFRAGAPRPARDTTRPGQLPLRVAVVAVLAGSLAVAVIYLRPNNTFWNATLLAAPLAASIGWMALRTLRRRISGDHLAESLAGVTCCLAGALVLPAGYAAWYASQGSLDELFFNTLYGLPQTVNWLVPFQVPRPRMLLALAALVAAAMAIRLWRAPAAPTAVGRWAAGIALAIALLAAMGVVAELAAAGILRRYISAGAWIGDAFSLVYVIPLLTVWAALAVLFRGGPAVATRSSPLALFFFSGAATLLQLYPSADVLHSFMLLPPFFPLLAFCLDAFHRAPSGDRAGLPGVLASAAFVTVVVLILAAPFLHGLATRTIARPESVPEFSRATGVADSAPKFRETGDLVRHLIGRPRDEWLFSIAGDQMVYFLAGKVSPLEKHEYILYLVQGGVIREEDARALVPERMIIDRLTAVDSLVIDYEPSPLSAGFRRVYPGVAQLLETRYRLAGTFGGYRLWGPLARPGEARPFS